MKIYISGSIYGGQEKIETYKILIKELEKYGIVYDKQIADPEVIEKEVFQKDEEIFLNLESCIKDADILFAEITVPSLGVGYEIGLADSLGKKIIGIYDKTKINKVSTMLRGNKRIRIIEYSNIKEITDNLERYLYE